MALPNRRSALAALVIAGASTTALLGIAVDADGRLFGSGRATTVATAGIDELDDPAADTSAAAPAETTVAGQGSIFEFSAPLGSITAVGDDTTVSVMREGGETITVNLNREQTYVVSGAARWFVGADKPVAVVTGRDRRVQPIR